MPRLLRQGQAWPLMGNEHHGDADAWAGAGGVTSDLPSGRHRLTQSPCRLGVTSTSPSTSQVSTTITISGGASTVQGHLAINHFRLRLQWGRSAVPRHAVGLLSLTRCSPPCISAVAAGPLDPLLETRVSPFLLPGFYEKKGLGGVCHSQGQR